MAETVRLRHDPLGEVGGRAARLKGTRGVLTGCSGEAQALYQRRYGALLSGTLPNTFHDSPRAALPNGGWSRAPSTALRGLAPPAASPALVSGVPPRGPHPHRCPTVSPAPSQNSSPVDGEGIESPLS